MAAESRKTTLILILYSCSPIAWALGVSLILVNHQLLSSHKLWLAWTSVMLVLAGSFAMWRYSYVREEPRLRLRNCLAQIFAIVVGFFLAGYMMILVGCRPGIIAGMILFLGGLLTTCPGKDFGCTFLRSRCMKVAGIVLLLALIASFITPDGYPKIASLTTTIIAIVMLGLVWLEYSYEYDF